MAHLPYIVHVSLSSTGGGWMTVGRAIDYGAALMLLPRYYNGLDKRGYRVRIQLGGKTVTEWTPETLTDDVWPTK